MEGPAINALLVQLYQPELLTTGPAAKVPSGKGFSSGSADDTAGCRDQRELGLGERERSAGVIVLAHSPYPVRSTLLATVSPAWTIYGRRLGRAGRNVWRWTHQIQGAAHAFTRPKPSCPSCCRWWSRGRRW